MKKRHREPKPLIPALASATGPALIKHLASCNTTVRSQSLRLLHSWLESQPQQLSDSDVKKLWKGLFYCLWHADKTPNQVALINRLTSLFLSLQSSISLEFFRWFLLTLRREWPGIDRLRLDKFYLLIRRFVKSLFELMRLRKWDVDVLREYFGVLESDGFLAEDKLQGNGVNYHVVSVFLEELKGVAFPMKKEVVDVILRTFSEALKRSKDRLLVGKVKSCFFEELLKMGKEMLANKKAGVDCDQKDGDVLLGMVALRMGLSAALYEVGSSVDCIQGNRKVALGLHEEFLNLEKELESSGFEIVLPEYIDPDDEVPQLIPIDNGNMQFRFLEGADKAREEEGQTGDRKVKKSKKEKKGVDLEDKKAKRRKKKKRSHDSGASEINTVLEESGNMVTSNGVENSPLSTVQIDLGSDGNEVEFNDIAIANLQKQFEEVAARSGSYNGEHSDISEMPFTSAEISAHAKKRKRTKGAKGQEPGSLDSIGTEDQSVDGATKSVEKSAKRVRFAMKNNLVWKPQTPLPPESLRLPPSVTPRGSALKKGVPPGPIIELPPAKKRVKQKKTKKILVSATPVVKRRKMMLMRSI